MKKLLGLISLLIYFVSTNALIHADSMGLLMDHANRGSSCHAHHTTTPTTNQNADCCELVYSNNYSQINIQPQIIQQYFNTLTTSQFSFPHILETPTRHILSNNFSP